MAESTAQSQGLTSPPNTSTPSLVTAGQYAHQYRTLMDKQRKAFDEERNLWDAERTDLLAEIERLKAKLRPGSTPSQTTSPIGSGNFSGYSGFPTASTGDEFWRGAGGKSDAQPTRTFFDPPNPTTGQRLPSNSENQPPRTSLLTSPLIKPTIPSTQSGGDLDGINFRKSRDTSSNDTSLDCVIATPKSPSSLKTSPRGRGLRLPRQPLQPPPECNTLHAGHTPLARMDGAASRTSTNPTTPTHPEVERPPTEPRPSFVRPPAERSDSYFPGAVDEDPALKEPLSLENAPAPRSEAFLGALDSKLEKVAKGKDDQAKEQGTEDRAEPSVSYLKLPDLEPELKMKKSLNFGSQLGSLR